MEIFGANENQILDLYDRSLLKLIDSDERFGKIEDPDYWLYNFHPAIKNYVEGLWRKEDDELETKYGKRYSTFYCNLVASTYLSQNSVPSLARFSIVFKGEHNDFERAAKLLDDKKLGTKFLMAAAMLGVAIYLTD